MNKDLFCSVSHPLIKVAEGNVVEVNDMFLTLTGFGVDELQSQSIDKVFEKLFRNNANNDSFNLDNPLIIFTKALEPRFVVVSKLIDCKSGITYIFREIENSRLDSKLLFLEKLIAEDVLGIGIFAAQDFTLIKANQTYLNYLPKSFQSRERAYGKQLKAIFTDFEGNYAEATFKNIVTRNESQYISEKQGLMLGGDNRYWDNTLTPISENGEVKFVVSVLKDVTENVLGREHIRIKNEQLEAVVNNLNDGVAIIDKGGFVISANNTIREILNLNIDEGSVIKKIQEKLEAGQKFYCDAGNEIDMSNLPLLPLLRGEKIKSKKIITYRGSEKVYLEVDGIPIKDKYGDFELGVIIVKDMTEQQKNSEEIKRQNKRFQAIIECIDDIVSILDKDGNYLKRNSILNNLFKAQYSNFYELAEKETFYNEDGSLLMVEDFCTAKVLKGEKVRNQKVKFLKGEEEIFVNYNGIPIFDDLGNLDMCVIIAHDVSEIINSSKEIEKQKILLENIIDNMHDGLVALDKDGETIKVNKAFKNTIEKAFGVKPSVDHVKFSVSSGQKYFTEEGRELSPAEIPAMRVLRGEHVIQQRVMIERGAKRVYVDFNCTPIFDKEGNFQFGIVIRHDITDIIEKENKIKEQQELLYKSERNQRETLEKALAMKDEFLSLISHEFRTPLNVINTAVQTMELILTDELSDRMKKYLGMIKQNTFRQLRLVNNLLDITRINSGSIKITKKNIDIVFLTRAITESVQAYAEQKGIDLRFDSSLEEKVIAIDDEKYERILLNLLSNAIKFTIEGETIEVTLDMSEGKIRIGVADNGIGIPQDKLHVIFERFGQVDSSLSRQAEGTGIGLSLVKKFVEAIGGSIFVSSKLGKGTSFIILLNDEVAHEEEVEKDSCCLMDNRIIQTTHIEFSDIYL